MTASRVSRLLKLQDFEVWRVRGLVLLSLTSVLIVAYWALWLIDRSVITDDQTEVHIAFEQSFPLADAWLLTMLLAAAVQLWRRRPSAVLWMFAVGGAAMYLCAMDVLYNLQQGIYAKGEGGMLELAINVGTGAMAIGTMRTGWRFRHRLFDKASADD